MSAKKTDISQIRKYLAGELDARAMHQLEREAQDDPFLMDAIEGYSLRNTEQQAPLNELRQRLQQRVSKGKVYRLHYRMAIAAAASVLVVLSIGYWLWPRGQQARVKQVALSIPKTQVTPTRYHTLLKPIGKQQLAATKITSAANKPQQQEQLSQAAPPATTSAGVSVAAVTTAAPGADVKPTDTIAHIASAYQPKPNDSITTGAALAAAKLPAAANNNALTKPEPAKMMRAAVMAKPAAKINGIISDETGHPLAGVTVTEKGKSDGVKTDSKGKFSFPGQDGELLSITLSGYDTKEVKGDTRDSLNVILRSAGKSISEMVAIGFGQSLATQRIKAAHPQIGWDSYNAYLKTRAVSADGKAGTVRLAFTVDGKGQLANFKVTKSLSPVADALAISIVKTGPAWSPDVSGATKTISLKIEFKRQQP